MAQDPSSMILFLSICSLTKATGGHSQYLKGASIASELPPKLAERLLKRRNEVRRLVRESEEVDWQGVPLSQLEFNHDLTAGPDFGGRRTAAFRPAVERYEGRFFQALGGDRKTKLAESKHHVLFLSGLYGLLRPLEPVQLYSCPLKHQIADLWVEDDLLTDLLCEYIRARRIAKVIDLTAMDAYRKLIDWERVAQSKTEVLHVVDSMAGGDYALTSFGRLLGIELLRWTEDELIALKPGSRVDTAIFQSAAAEHRGHPSEFDATPPRPAEELEEGLRGGIPEVRRSARLDANVDTLWHFATTREFERDVRHRKDIYPQILVAANEICRDPFQPRAKKVKRLTNEYHVPGAWRYKIGDFRLVYVPDTENRRVIFQRVKHRNIVYRP